MNGKDENGDDDGVDVAQPHERRVQLIEVLLVDVVHETLSSGPRRAAARRGVPWMKYIAQSIPPNIIWCKTYLIHAILNSCIIVVAYLIFEIIKNC